MAVDLACDNAAFRVSGDRTLVPYPELGVAICKLRVSAGIADQRTVLKASIPARECVTELHSVDPVGPKIKIQLRDKDHGNQRYRWIGNILEVAAQHPSLRRYLGPPDDFPGQEELHFRVLLAEIVAEAVCSLVLSRNAASKPEEYQDADWDAYYAEYTKLLTKFLPIAHESQVKI
jgi:hypothetical protein